MLPQHLHATIVRHDDVLVLREDVRRDNEVLRALQRVRGAVLALLASRPSHLAEVPGDRD